MEPPWKAYNVLKKMDYPYEVSTTKSIYQPNSLLCLLHLYRLMSHIFYFSTLFTA